MSTDKIDRGILVPLGLAVLLGLILRDVVNTRKR